MATTSTGGCACGAIRYEVSADPANVRELLLPRLPEIDRRGHGVPDRRA